MKYSTDISGFRLRLIRMAWATSTLGTEVLTESDRRSEENADSGMSHRARLWASSALAIAAIGAG
jgi:hypothetical protein